MSNRLVSEALAPLSPVLQDTSDSSVIDLIEPSA